MVRVLTHGGQDLKSVQRHLAYLDRKGELELETDEGERLAGKGVEKELLEDWDLDLEEDRRRVHLGPLKDRSRYALTSASVMSTANMTCWPLASEKNPWIFRPSGDATASTRVPGISVPSSVGTI
jgi:hypothetical protein